MLSCTFLTTIFLLPYVPSFRRLFFFSVRIERTTIAQSVGKKNSGTHFYLKFIYVCMHIHSRKKIIIIILKTRRRTSSRGSWKKENAYKNSEYQCLCTFTLDWWCGRKVTKKVARNDFFLLLKLNSLKRNFVSKNDDERPQKWCTWKFNNAHFLPLQTNTFGPLVSKTWNKISLKSTVRFAHFLFRVLLVANS